MKIKKFLAPTLKEATEKMKKELGSEAIILSTRVVEEKTLDNVVRLFEITSGIEEEKIEFKQQPAVQEQSTFVAEEKSPVLASTSEKPANGSLASFKEELNNFQFEKLKTPFNFSAPVKDLKTKLNSIVKQPIDDGLKDVIDTLINHEVQKPLIKMVVNQLKKSKNLLNTSNLDSYVISCLSSMIPTTDFKLAKGKKSKVVALVGPTGVGKTTSIAKLAAISKILHNLDVGIISIDTFRLGAIDQLRIFSEISNIDLLVAYEPEEMPGLISRLKNKDLILIDTVGRSQKNKDELKNIKKFLEKVPVDDTLLVLSATNSVKNLMDAADKFSLFNYDSFLFTKIDEAITYGNLINITMNYNKPIIFLTNGQVIPDDIISADSEFIAKIIYTGLAV
jgi:flagellar biosynthesis protein FlhF